MARLRGLGRGLGRASESISGLIDAYIKSAFLEESQRRQNELMSKRQSQLSAQGHRQNITERLLANPNDADRIIRNSGTDVSGVSVSPFRSTTGELLNPILKPIIDAKNLNELPPEIITQIQAQNSGLRDHPEGMMGLDEALKSNEAKRSALLTEDQVAENLKPRLGPDNVTGFVSRSGSFLPTERTGTQEGVRGLDTLRAGEGSPEGIRLKGDIAQEEASGRAMGTVLGTHAVKDEFYELERLKARAAAEGRGGIAQMVGLLLPTAQKMIELARKINTTRRGDDPTLFGDVKHALLNRFGGSLELLRQSNPDLNELDRLVEGMTITFTGILGHTGVRTQRDVDSTKAILPDWGRYQEDSERTIANFSKLLAAALEMGERMGPIDPNLPPELQSAEYQRRLGLVRGLAGVDSPQQPPPPPGTVSLDELLRPN